MIPGYHSNCNFKLIGDGKSVIDVPACLNNYEDGSFGSVITYWKPTPKELELLNANGFVAVHVMQMPPPPIWVEAVHG